MRGQPYSRRLAGCRRPATRPHATLIPPTIPLRESEGTKSNNIGRSPQMQGLFPLRQIVATPGALETLARANQTPNEFLLRHISGDWELDAHDLADNMYS